jgi:predicted MPP superfamily phosphohydrolase
MLILIILGAALFTYAWLIEPARLAVGEESVQVAGISPIRLLFISDLHIGWHTRMGWLHKRLGRLKGLHASRPVAGILLGGDFLDASGLYIPQLEGVLAELASWKVPIYAVLGNHDYDSLPKGLEELEQAFKGYGVRLLRNESAVLQGIHLIGIDDLQTDPVYHNGNVPMPATQWRQRAGELDWYSEQCAKHPGLPKVVLSHNPDAALLPGDPRPSLVLAGHTHGGQMAWVPPLAPTDPSWQLLSIFRTPTARGNRSDRESRLG